MIQSTKGYTVNVESIVGYDGFNRGDFVCHTAHWSGTRMFGKVVGFQEALGVILIVVRFTTGEVYSINSKYLAKLTDLEKALYVD